METFADYILSERRFDKKLAIMYFLQKKVIFILINQL